MAERSRSQCGEPGVLADRFDVFLFDLDGVIYLGREPLPGARETLSRLRSDGKTIRFLTNDPRPTRAQVARRLADMRVGARPEEVVTSGWATASYLREESVGSAYVLGSRGLASEIVAAGVEVVDEGPCDAVVVGSDEHVSYSHIRRASRLIFDGSRFVATNADSSFPSPKGPLPGTGAIVEAIKVVTGEEPVVVGKPYPPMFDMALMDLGVSRDRIVMVGDTPASDIVGAHLAGITGVLVSREHDLRFRVRDLRAPDAVITDLTGLTEVGVTVRAREGVDTPSLDSADLYVILAVVDAAKRLLLVKREGRSAWEVPTVNVGSGAPMWQVLKGAGLEGSEFAAGGIEVTGVYREPGSGGNMGHALVLRCRCEVAAGDGEPGEIEVSEARFFDRDVLPGNLSEAHRRLLESVFACERDAARR